MSSRYLPRVKYFWCDNKNNDDLLIEILLPCLNKSHKLTDHVVARQASVSFVMNFEKRACLSLVFDKIDEFSFSPFDDEWMKTCHKKVISLNFEKETPYHVILAIHSIFVTRNMGTTTHATLKIVLLWLS